MTPANFWPDMSASSTPMSVGTGSTTAASSGTEARHQAWPAPRLNLRPGFGLTASMFGGQASPFSADVTPIAAAGGSSTTRSDKSGVATMTLASMFDAAGDATPMNSDLPSRFSSSNSLNNARFLDG